jgi:acetolactate synthase-1/2/3 large subunit
MNGAESLIATARAAGIDACFANPGTSEMALVTALDAVPGIRPVLGLFEGVCTGAADGFSRMTGRPAMTLLHPGPGLANGLANLHNARRARTPVLNVVGEHATWHLGTDSALESDTEGLAAPVSAWVRTSRSASAVATDCADALAAATAAPGHVATLIVPADLQDAPAPSRMLPAEINLLCRASAEEDVAAALAAVADELGASVERRSLAPLDPPPKPSGGLDGATLSAAVAATLPEHAVVVDEGATSSVLLYPALASAAPHSWLTLTRGGHRPGTAVCDRCSDRVPRPTRRFVPGRWQRPLHDAGPVDAGS